MKFWFTAGLLLLAGEDRQLMTEQNSEWIDKAAMALKMAPETMKDL